LDDPPCRAPRRQFLLLLRDAGGDVQTELRLRRLLKALLRSYSFRCVTVEELPPDADGDSGGRGGDVALGPAQIGGADAERSTAGDPICLMLQG
jgi:hypothetical protein